MQDAFADLLIASSLYFICMFLYLLGEKNPKTKKKNNPNQKQPKTPTPKSCKIFSILLFLFALFLKDILNYMPL